MRGVSKGLRWMLAECIVREVDVAHHKYLTREALGGRGYVACHVRRCAW